MSLARIEDSFRRGDVLVHFGHAIGGTEAAGQKGSAKGSDQQAAAQDMGDRPFAHPYFWAGFIYTGL